MEMTRESASAGGDGLVLVTYEDRATDVIGLKLLVASLRRYGGDYRLICYCPAAWVEFVRWASQFAKIEVRDSTTLSVRGWEVKPALLQMVLAEGNSRVTWIDSDILLAKPLNLELVRSNGDALVATEECHCHDARGVPDRAALAGFGSARRFGSSINSGIVAVTTQHLPLLSAWQACMSGSDFQGAQREPFYHRPLHLRSDQDVLDALLGSEQFAQVPIVQLRAGGDIAQCWGLDGFSFGERMHALVRGSPPLLHAQGPKPWRPPPDADWVARVALELSPYSAAARRLRGDVDEPIDWTRPRSPLARLFMVLGFGNATLAGAWFILFVRAGSFTLNLVRRAVGRKLSPT